MFASWQNTNEMISRITIKVYEGSNLDIETFVSVEHSVGPPLNSKHAVLIIITSERANHLNAQVMLN